MANASAWNSNLPSGTSRIRDSDDQIRSDKSILAATLETEHYFSSSSLSAGIHKPGSARVHVGTLSQVSTVADSGRLMFTTDRPALHYLSSASTVSLEALFATNGSTSTSLSTVARPTNFSSGLSRGGVDVATVVVSATTPSTYTEGTIWVQTA